MENETTILRAYVGDTKRLRAIVPGAKNDQERLRIVLDAAALPECPHPEASRQYTTALIPAPDEDAIINGVNRRIYGGFHCAACKRYIIPDVETQA